MSNSKSSGGISGAFLLGIVFVTLKLCHVIDWSWWWVTIPFWGTPALLLAIAAILGIFGLVCLGIEKAFNK